MREYWLIIRKGFHILDRGGRRHGIAITLLSALQSLMDGFGLAVVLVAMRVSMDPGLLAKVPKVQHFLQSLGLKDRGSLTIALFSAAAIFYMVKARFGIFIGWLTKEFAWSQRDRLTETLLRNFVRWDYLRLVDFSAASLQKDLTAVEYIAKYFLIPAITLLSESAALVVIAVTLVLVQPVLLAAVLVLGGTAIGTGYTARRYTNSREKDFQQTVVRLLTVANEIFGSVRDIKLYAVPDFFINTANQQVLENSDIQKRVTFAIELPRIILETALVIALCGAMVIMVLTGSDLTTALPFATTLVIAMIRLLPAANRMLMSLNLIRFGAPAVNDVAAALAVPLEPAPRPDELVPISFTRDIRVKDLVFRYPQSESPALNGIEIEIKRGEFVAFVGGSGSGKTTMANLLLGLLKPTGGMITVDDQPVADHLAAWRAKVAFVPQDVFLLDDTLRRNIAFGQADSWVDEAAIRRALRLAQLENLINDLPEGLDTRIGDRGGRLSGGQRLRVAIARALYFGREVLVLDEATSALDPRTEREITNAIESLRGKVTVIVVAHRMSTVQQCDRLYVFQEGRIVESGSFDELSRESAEFRSLIGAGQEVGVA